MDRDHKTHDFQYPSNQQLSFDNPIVGFVHKPGNWCGVNIIMANGAHSELPLNIQGGKGYSIVYIDPQNTRVHRVVMKGDNEFGGVICYDPQNRKILEAGHTFTLHQREFTLKDNERLLGIKSHLIGKFGGSLSPRQEDLVFIIGWLE